MKENWSRLGCSNKQQKFIHIIKHELYSSRVFSLSKGDACVSVIVGESTLSLGGADFATNKLEREFVDSVISKPPSSSCTARRRGKTQYNTRLNITVKSPLVPRGPNIMSSGQKKKRVNTMLSAVFAETISPNFPKIWSLQNNSTIDACAGYTK